MKDSEQFDLWAKKSHWSDWDLKPERAHLLLHLVKSRCELIPSGEWLSTTKLLKAILPDAGPKTLVYANNGIGALKKAGKLDGYYFQGPKSNITFGRHTSRWCNPNHTHGTTGLEDVLS